MKSPGDCNWDAGEDDFDKPVLPREKTFEEARAGVPGDVVKRLREFMLLDPEWVCVPCKAERRARGRLIRLDELSRANLQAEELLRQCHHKRLIRQRTSPCYQFLADAKLADIAQRVIRHRDNHWDTLDDAIDRELTQIEANEFAYFWQESGEGTYEDGLETFNEKRLKEHKEFLDYMKRKPSWNWERDADGTLRPVAIEAGLKALMSYPGFRGRRAHEARERHFTAFLAATLAAEHPERSAEEMCAEAQAQFEVMCQEGFISPIIFRHALLWFSLWRDDRARQQCVAAWEKSVAARCRAEKT